jgi:hypothetical protein
MGPWESVPAPAGREREGAAAESGQGAAAGRAAGGSVAAVSKTADERQSTA